MPDTTQWIVASTVLFVVIATFIVAALRGPRWWRAASFGIAAAVTGAFSAALTKAITTYITEGWGHVLTHAQPYLLAITGIGTVFLLQNALHAGSDHRLPHHLGDGQPAGEHPPRRHPLRRPASHRTPLDDARGPRHSPCW